MDKRTNHFQHTVLIGIWAIILFLMKCDFTASKRAVEFREDAIRFGDQFGTPGDDAKRVRRERTYGMP